MAPSAEGAIRVLLIGDDPLALSGLAFLLGEAGGFSIIGQGGPDEAGAMAAMAATAATAAVGAVEVAVWDVGRHASEWLGRLRAGSLDDPEGDDFDDRDDRDDRDGGAGQGERDGGGDSGLAVVALLQSEADAAAVLSAGARGLLLRNIDAKRLAAAIRSVSAGLLVFDPAIRLSGDAAQAMPAARDGATVEPTLIEPLTPRETEVLQLVAQGYSNRRIAESLGISEHTAKFHVAAIVAKLGASTRTEAAMRAARLGLVLL